MPVGNDLEIEQRIAAMRRFNRFYTQHLGVLQDGWLDSPFSLTEARVLYEIGQRGRATATDIARDLDLDDGYLSRILHRFQKSGLVARQTSPDDARQSLLSMTAKGRKAFAPLEERTLRQVGGILGNLSAPQQEQLVSSMQTVEALLAGRPAAAADVILRQPRPGDFGWIVARHAVVYAQEFGWTEPFEGVCAQIVADFVMLVKDKPEVARLRLLFVEPSARGLGIGRQLTGECVRFARQSGYRRITLWTHSVLTAARHIYAEAGFQLTSSEPRRSFGQDVVSEHWDLTL
jgi:DNA-binding MarR family transcriptional regulator/predicted GNAT family acetyltransferase